MLFKHKNGFKIFFYYVTIKASEGLMLNKEWLPRR